MKTFPTDQRVLFLPCDMARTEGNGKITLLGYFGGEEIRLSNSAKFPVSFPLGLVFMLRDGQGDFAATIQVDGPHGNVLPRSPAPAISKPAGDNHGVILNFSPMTINEYGQYTFTLRLEDVPYVRHMNFVAA
jgi:hypothetical protein